MAALATLSRVCGDGWAPSKTKVCGAIWAFTEFVEKKLRCRRPLSRSLSSAPAGEHEAWSRRGWPQPNARKVCRAHNAAAATAAASLRRVTQSGNTSVFEMLFLEKTLERIFCSTTCSCRRPCRSPPPLPRQQLRRPRRPLPRRPGCSSTRCCSNTNSSCNNNSSTTST